MEIRCSSCGKITQIKQKYAFHSGFSNVGFLYCDRYSAILKFDTYNKKYTTIVGDKHPWSLNSEEKKRVEDALKPYKKDGRFRFEASPRCPVCNALLPDLLKDKIHFIEIGEVINADKEDVWIV